MSTARRNVPCIVCGRAWPEVQSQRAYAGRAGTVPVWSCNRCFKDPAAGLAARQAAQAKAAERAHRRE